MYTDSNIGRVMSPFRDVFRTLTDREQLPTCMVGCVEGICGIRPDLDDFQYLLNDPKVIGKK